MNLSAFSQVLINRPDVDSIYRETSYQLKTKVTDILC